MAKMIEVYVHVEGSQEPKLVKVSEDATLKDIAQAVDCHLEKVEEFFFGRQDEDEPMNHGHHLHEAGVGHRHHVHCHRCKKILVTVKYNGTQKQHEFSPAVRLHKVLHWATDEFHLHGSDAADMALFLPEEVTPADGDVHVGSLASFPDCQVSFVMNVPVQVNG